MAQRDYALNVIANISEYQSKIGEIPGFTERMAARTAEKVERRAAKQDAAVVRGHRKAAEQARKKWEAEGKKAADAWEQAGSSAAKDLEQQLEGVAERSGDAEQGLIGLVDILGLVSPAAEDALRPIADVAGGLEGIIKGSGSLVRIAGPVAIALAAMAAGSAYLEAELEKANEETERAAELAERAERAYDSWENATRDLADRVDLATGAVDELELKQRKETEAFREATQARIDHERQLARTAAAEAERLQALLDEGEIREEHVLGLNAARAAYENHSRAVEALEKKQREGIATIDLLVQHERDEVDAASERAAEAERLRDALQGVTHAEAELVDALEEELEVLLARRELTAEDLAAEADARAKLGDLVAETARGELGAFERLEQARDRALEQEEELTGRRLELAGDFATSREVILEESVETRLALEAAFEERRLELVEEAAQKEKELRLEATVAAGEAGLDAVSTFADLALDRRVEAIEELEAQRAALGENATTEEIVQLEQRIRAEEKAAQRSFKIGQAAAVTGIAIDTAMGIQKVIGQYGLPFGLIPAAAVAASGIAQTAVVMSQPAPTAAHVGEAIAAPGQLRDEVDRRLLVGEGVVNRTGMRALGADGLNAINRGRSPGAGSLDLTLEYRGRAVQRMTKDLARQVGPFRDATRARRVGHRER